MRLASSGYTGDTLLFTFRFPSSVEEVVTCCANPAETAKSSATVPKNKSLLRIDLINSSSENEKHPGRERHAGCQGSKMLVQRNDAQAKGCNTFKRLEMNRNSENRRLRAERRCCLMGYEEVAGEVSG
jgi:hypothetical protein